MNEAGEILLAVIVAIGGLFLIVRGIIAFMQSPRADNESWW